MSSDPFERCDQTVPAIDTSDLIEDCAVPDPPEVINECETVQLTPQVPPPENICPVIGIGGTVLPSPDGQALLTITADDASLLPTPEDPADDNTNPCQYAFAIRLYLPSMGTMIFPVQLDGGLYCSSGPITGQTLISVTTPTGQVLAAGTPVWMDGTAVAGYLPAGTIIRATWKAEFNASNPGSQQAVPLTDGLFAGRAVLQGPLPVNGTTLANFEEDTGGISPFEVKSPLGAATSQSLVQVTWNTNRCCWEMIPSPRTARFLAPVTSCSATARGWLDDKREISVAVDVSSAIGYHPMENLITVTYDPVSNLWKPTSRGVTSVVRLAKLDARPGKKTLVQLFSSEEFVLNRGPGRVRNGNWVTCIWNEGTCQFETTPGSGGGELFCVELSQELRGESGQTALGFPCDGTPQTITVTPVRFRGYLFPGQLVDCLPPESQEDGEGGGSTESSPYIAIGGGGCHYIHGNLATTLGKRSYGYVNTPLGVIQVFGRYGKAQNGTEIGCLWNAGTKFWDAALQACDDNNSAY